MLKLRSDSLPIRIIIAALGLSLIILVVLYIFSIKVMLLESFIYLVLALAIPMLFLSYRATRTTEYVMWYDYLFAVLGAAVCLYLSQNSANIIRGGWAYEAPTKALIAACILLVLLIEGTRRTNGWIIAGLCTFFIAEPMFSDKMPGILMGIPFSFPRTISSHVFGTDSLFGPVGRVTGTLLLGYLLFAATIDITGGGKFLLNLAISLFGKARGAAAKVSVISSALFGTLSGATVPNILTTGAFTIPAMKKSGYAPAYAAAVEACASTGGNIMPPVMGAAAFIMAEMTGTPYWTICIAAALPAIIYYIVLFVQADAYAGRMNIRGVPGQEIPSFWATLKGGYPYYASVVVLIWFLAFQRMESQAPFFATIALLAVASFRKSSRPSPAKLLDITIGTAKLTADLVVLMSLLGVVMGALTITGLGPVLAFLLVQSVGGVKLLIPIVAAIAGYILGVGLPATAIYVLFSVTVAPALVKAGYPLIPSHMYVMWVGLLSFIIPPVALAAITAGKLIGEKSVFKVGFISMRLGMGLFVLPLVFIYCPSLLLGQGPISETIFHFCAATIGMVLLSMSFEKFFIRYKLNLWQALGIGAAGAIIALYPVMSII